MDDRKIYEMTRLKLAYEKQLYYIGGLMLFTLMGIILYVMNIYRYNFQLFIVSLVIIITGLIGLATMDQKTKNISRKIKELG